MAMFQYWVPAAQFFSAAVMFVCFAIALVVINLQVTGRARSLGVGGVVLLSLSTIVEVLNSSVGSAYGTAALAYGVGSVAVTVLAAAGLVLIALAAISARKARTPRGDH